MVVPAIMALQAKMAIPAAQDHKDLQANLVVMAHPAIQVPLAIPDLKEKVITIQ
jgi:hypothetical protein